MGIIKNIADGFKTIKKVRDDFNSNLDEHTEEMKRFREAQHVEFCEKFKNDKNSAFDFIESDIFLGIITQKEYEIREKIIKKAIIDFEDKKISKEEFFHICLRNKK